jgi:hypothetical protein
MSRPRLRAGCRGGGLTGYRREQPAEDGLDMIDAPPIIIDEDAAIDSAFFGLHAGRNCYARAHRSGWVLVVRQVVAQREPPVMLRVWGRVERVPDDDVSCLALWERCANLR